jgi:hypothetical protein
VEAEDEDRVVVRSVLSLTVEADAQERVAVGSGEKKEKRARRERTLG